MVLVVELGKFTRVPNRGKCVQVLDTSIAVAMVDDPAVICTRYPVKSVDGGVTLQVTVFVPPAATVVGTLPVLTVAPRWVSVKPTEPLHEPVPVVSWTTALTVTAVPGL